ncbi:MAG: molybdopterin-binding protein [Pseudomonadota bacterium]
MGDQAVTACLLIIGNEILSGRTQDKNLGYLAERLNDWGVRLMEARVIPDVPETIIATLNEVRVRFDYVFTTGGIGPTHDDITSECVARAFGLPHGLHPEAHAILQAHYAPGELNEARLRMAKTPEGATLIENPISKAPGFQVENVFVMAGVPAIMQVMVDSLRNRVTGGAPMLSRTIKVGLPEGGVAADLGALQDDFPDIEIGSYPYYHQADGYGVRLVLRGTDAARLDQAVERLDDIIGRLGGKGDWEPVMAPSS